VKWGIALTKTGSPPPGDEIIGWRTYRGRHCWDSKGEALEANDLDGWRGYVCEYPSGRRLSAGEGV